MKTISRVLCAVDIDEPGRAAFAQAIALARAHAAKILIVYAVPVEQTFNTGATERLAYLQELRDAAEAVEVPGAVAPVASRPQHTDARFAEREGTRAATAQ